jgi:transcriptional accessory protein Tex/SPT6
MIDLSSIATELQLPPEQLRVAVELLSQGYQPPFISSFRADESGSLPEKTLWRLKGILERQSALAEAQRKGLEEINQSPYKIPGLEKAVQEARTAREIDRLLRPLHSKKNSFTFAERHPQAAKVLDALQSNEVPTAEHLSNWVVSQFGIEASQVEAVLGQVRHLLVLKLSENPALLTKLRRQISKKGVLAAELVKEEAGATAKVDADSASSTSAASIAAAVAAEQHEEHKLPEVALASEDLVEELLPQADEELESEGDVEGLTAAEDVLGSESELSEAILQESSGLQTTEAAGTVLPVTGQEISSSESATTQAASVSTPPQGKGKKAKVEVRLTPRQRRRRWLQSMLQPYDGLKKPLHKLSSYQVVMLARGQRTQLIKTTLDYDRAGLVLLATESLVPPQHPLTAWMDEVASEALGRVVLPRIEQDVFAELEDQAHEKLLLQAGEHFSAFVTQRPLRGHTILCIDAVGPKLAPVAIIGPQGQVLAIEEIACQGGKAETKAAVVTKIGELVHKHRVSLIVLSNGPARRSLMPALAELLDQSTPGSVRFSLIDRTGADAYATTRIASDELGRFSRRHRSAVWLARRIQDSRREIMKIDVARLRLGSYQGELSTDRLRSTLNEVVSATMASDGVDVMYASEAELQRIPGVTADVAAAIVQLRNQGNLANRGQLLEALATQWSAQQSRQAIGFLRLFNSTNPLDGTTIHPDDYHLATRLATSLGLSLPAQHPEGWTAPVQASASADKAVAAESPITDGNPPATEIAALDSAAAVPSSETGADSPTPDQASGDNTLNSENQDAQVQVALPEADSSVASAATPSTSIPETEATPAPAINNLDVEKYAKSWQVGREKLKRISRILQYPFEDRRLTQPLIPLWTKVPKMEDLQPGMSLWGVIVGLADFGAFADLGIDCQGLIHVSRLAPGYVEDPHQFVQIGDLIRVWVVSIDRDKKRISLSAIAPGTEVPQQRAPRGPMSDDRAQAGRGGNARGPRGGGVPAGDSRGPRRADGGNRDGGQRFSGPREGGNRDGGNRGGPPRSGSPGRGDNYRGSGGRGRGSDRSNRADEQTAADRQEMQAISKPKVDRPAKPAPKLTEAMQKGREPLRSFSDLMQFYQTQKDPTPPPPVTAADTGDPTVGNQPHSSE